MRRRSGCYGNRKRLGRIFFGDLRLANVSPPKPPTLFMTLANIVQSSSRSRILSQYEFPRKGSIPGLSNLGMSGMLRNATTSRNPSPTKSRVGSESGVGLVRSSSSASASASPKKQPPRERKSSIWDSLFQVDISYQSSKSPRK